MYKLNWKARRQVNKLLFSKFQNKSSLKVLVIACSIFAYWSHFKYHPATKGNTCPTYIIRKLTLSCRRVTNFPQTPIKWWFGKFILCRVLSIQIVSALKTAFKTRLRHVCYALCNQKTGTEKKKWNVQFLTITRTICHHLLFFMFFILFYVGALTKDTRPWKSTFDRLLPLLKELLERVW